MAAEKHEAELQKTISNLRGHIGSLTERLRLAESRTDHDAKVAAEARAKALSDVTEMLVERAVQFKRPEDRAMYALAEHDVLALAQPKEPTR